MMRILYGRNQDESPSGVSPRVLRLARLALFWETLWPAAWPAVGIVGLFVALALFGFFEELSVWPHVIILSFFGVALAAALFRFARMLGLPSIGAVQRRIERDNGLAHRPLTALEDHLAVGKGDAFAEALWRAHLARMRKALGKIRIALPRPGLPRRDPLALRLLLVLLLTIGALGAGSEGPERIAHALLPQLGPFSARTPPAVQLWLTPPSYTRLAPVFLRAGGPEEGGKGAPIKDAAAVERRTIDVPAGSKVLARVQGGSGQPELLIGEKKIPFKAVDGSTYQLEDTLSVGDRLVVQQRGRAIAEWAIRVVPDKAPAVAFATPPSRTLRSALRLEYKAADDYGLGGVKAEIRRVDAPATESPIDLDLPLSNEYPREAHETSFHDLTPHPWAGLPVTVQLIARDEPGQIGKSEPFKMILPERVFNHPAARLIIEQRKQLTKDPDSREDVADALSALASYPQLFGGDIDVFLALIAARSQLRLSGEPASIASVQQLLWDTALALEEGRLSLAERNLRDLQRQLMEALERGAPDKEIQELISKLQDAIGRYLQEMAKQQVRNPNQNQPPLDKNAQILEMQDLQKLLDRMREMARTGARDAARQLLAQLQNMLENLRMARINPNGKSGNSASGLMRSMDDLISKQGRLLQRSFRESQGGQGMPMQQPGTPSSAAEQEALRRALGEIMRRMGELSGQIPEKLGGAERAMRDAVKALERGAPGDAVPSQSQALDMLRQGREAMRQGLRPQFGQEGGDPQDIDAFGPARDPMGRVMPGFGNFDSNDVKIPEHGAIQRARKIQEELQRRAGERQRPEIELDYIDRLLRRF